MTRPPIPTAYRQFGRAFAAALLGVVALYSCYGVMP